MSTNKGHSNSYRSTSRSTSSRASTGASSRSMANAIIEAATKKAEMECRVKALKTKHDLELEEYKLREKIDGHENEIKLRIKKLEQHKETLAIQTELKVQDAKLETLKIYDNSAASCGYRHDVLPEQEDNKERSVQQWVQNGTISVDSLEPAGKNMVVGQALQDQLGQIQQMPTQVDIKEPVTTNPRKVIDQHIQSLTSLQQRQQHLDQHVFPSKITVKENTWLSSTPAMPVLSPQIYVDNKAKPRENFGYYQESHHPAQAGSTTPLNDMKTQSKLVDEPDTTKELLKQQSQLTKLLIEQHQRSTLPHRNIQIFDGNPLEYHTFIRAFECGVEAKTNNDSDRMYFLEQSTTGQPNTLVRGMLHKKQCYEETKKQLYKKFGNKFVIATAFQKKAASWPEVKGDDQVGWNILSSFLTAYFNTMEDLKFTTEVDHSTTIKSLIAKLPYGVRHQWRVRVDKLEQDEERMAGFQDFAKFIERQTRIVSNPLYGSIGGDKGKQSNTNKTNNSYRRKSFATSTSVQQDRDTNNEKQPNRPTAKAKTCQFCGDGTKHAILDCRKFGRLTRKEKSDFCFKSGLCFGCLKKGHNKAECRNPEVSKCRVCSRNHPTILHDHTQGSATENKQAFGPTPEPAPSPNVTSTTASTSIIGAGIHSDTRENTSGPMMAIVPILVGTSACGDRISTYAFMDNGCGAVFADVRLRNALRVRTKPTKLLMRTMNLQEMLDTEIILDQIQVGHIDGTSHIDIPQVFVTDGLPVSLDDVPTQHDINQWEHLRQIVLPRLTNNCINRVTMIIGSNVPAATMPLEIVPGPIGDPYAIRTLLGWLVYGLPGKFKGQKEVDVNFCRVGHATVQTGVEHIHDHMQTCINMDFSEQIRDSQQELSANDKIFMTMMENSINKKDGHYEVMLPFKDNTITVPNNRLQAEIFAKGLGRRLKRDDRLHGQYNEFMNNLLDKGYAEQVPEHQIEADDRRRWYIPHHPVFNPHKPDKVRVVFNCPVVYKGTSLNQQLLQGPDLTNQLQGVLLRWRKEPVAVTADIESMFYQVRVRKEDCDMLRFLWWPNGQLTDKLKEYRMLVHVFGAVSSPSCANFALRRIAEECKQTKPAVADVILKAFYVDDMLKSFSSESEALEVSKETKETLRAGGFNLTKWLSNSRQVIQSMPKEDRAKEVKDLNLGSDTLPTERVLGVQWDVQADKLSFSYKEVEKTPTRRNILSIMSSLYDPLGMVAPYTLKAKIILQELCREKIGWDEEAPLDQQREWESWTSDLTKLKGLKIDRCMRPEPGEPTEIQLHHFADASTKGYGVVTYIRYITGEKIHCAFVMGKARVCPLRKITIPRLELTAARVAVRVDVQLTRELHGPGYEEVSSYFWTDSQTVLKYIHNQTSRFHTFVANRVSEIQEASQPSQWHYVPTERNPADECSRGLTMSQLLDSPRWFQGPEFLWKDESGWPQQPDGVPVLISTEDPEIRKSEVSQTESSVKIGVVVVNHEVEQNSVNTLINYYSSWLKLKRAVAWWLRLKRILQRKSRNQERQEKSKELTIEELQSAEEAILAFVQHQSFPEEIEALGNQKKIKPSSSILSLDPMISNGLLRVRGRLRNADISEDARHQIILPKVHHVTDVILNHVHRQCNHQGQNHMLATVRQKYWILRVSQRIKSLVRRCIICRRQRSKVVTQKMADLPAYRVKPDEPPFSSTGMDYFGPFEIKQGRVTRKRYGVVFTCMVTRAVHLEVADSLDTSSCINTLRRFIARRGHVKEITSDNGTNLVGANKELRQSIQQLEEHTIQKYTSSMEIQWKFNPPGASHHGGVWERHIRTIRKILQSMLTEQYMKVARSDDQLHTLMCEIEATINSRPLTRQSDDPSDLEVLTPNHLLQPQNPANFPPGVFDEKDAYAKKRWRQVQYMADIFWKRWLAEYLPLLQKRQKWLQPERNVKVGDIVLVIDTSAPRNSWTIGKVEKVNLGNQGLVRSVMVKTKSSTLLRPISKLCLLLEQDL